MIPQHTGDTAADGPYRELVLNAPDAILVVSNGKLLFANPAAARLVGLDESDSLLNHSVLEFVTPDSRDRITALIRQLHVDRNPASLFDTQVRRVDGSVRDVELMACPTLYDGVPASIVFVRDVTDRKRAERELTVSEEQYRQVVESMNEALIVYNADATVRFVNRQFCAMFHLKPEDIIDGNMSALFDSETMPIIRARMARRRLGHRDHYEARLTGRSGKSVLADISAAPLMHDGQFTGSLALVTDISEREVARERLQRSEERYHDLVDGIPDFIFSFDCQDRYVAANKAVRGLHGLREDEILGRTLEEVGIPAEVAAEWREQNARARESGQTIAAEYIVTFREGPPRILRRIVSPMIDEGKLAGVSGISVDITQQRHSEETNARLTQAIEEMDEVMFTTDEKARITYVNPAFERVYGYRREEVIGKTPRIIRSGNMPDTVYVRFWEELLAGRIVRKEFVNRRKDNSLVHVMASITPMHDTDGRITGFTAVQRDVTAERKAEEEQDRFQQQLAQTAKMQALGTLAGGIAHDFNNILSIVLTHASVAEMSKQHPERLASAIATIKAAVARGAGLSRQILTFARDTEARMECIDVNRVISEIGSMVREMFPRNIAIEVDLADGLPMLRADSDQIHQALLNLCLNARDAMEQGGTLRISTREVSQDEVRRSFPATISADSVRITVSDTGAGMSSETAGRIFEPFFTTKPVGKGTGLGLAVVYGVMKAHGGSIDVASEPGRGASFSLFFPAATAAAADHAPAGPVPVLGTESLLLIEDEPEIAAVLAEQLDERGYRVTSAASAADALAKIHDPSCRFDVIVSDLGIPGISSRELVNLLRRTAPDTPLIPMTGYVDPELHREVFAAGTEPILEKPFTVDELAHRIRRARRATAAA